MRPAIVRKPVIPQQRNKQAGAVPSPGLIPAPGQSGDPLGDVRAHVADQLLCVAAVFEDNKRAELTSLQEDGILVCLRLGSGILCSKLLELCPPLRRRAISRSRSTRPMLQILIHSVLAISRPARKITPARGSRYCTSGLPQGQPGHQKLASEPLSVRSQKRSREFETVIHTGRGRCVKMTTQHIDICQAVHIVPDR